MGGSTKGLTFEKRPLRRKKNTKKEGVRRGLGWGNLQIGDQGAELEENLRNEN